MDNPQNKRQLQEYSALKHVRLELCTGSKSSQIITMKGIRYFQTVYHNKGHKCKDAPKELMKRRKGFEGCHAHTSTTEMINLFVKCDHESHI